MNRYVLYVDDSPNTKLFESEAERTAWLRMQDDTFDNFYCLDISKTGVLLDAYIAKVDVDD